VWKGDLFPSKAKWTSRFVGGGVRESLKVGLHAILYVWTWQQVGKRKTQNKGQ